jgi:hypothetical protein
MENEYRTLSLARMASERSKLAWCNFLAPYLPK